MRAKRSKAKKKWLSWRGWALILLGLISLLLVGVAVILPMWLNEDRFARLIEDELNCRVDLDEVDLLIFRWPTEVHLRGLSLSARDKVAAGAVPQGQRRRVAEPVVRADVAVLELSLWQLLRRRLELRKVEVGSGTINYVLNSKGEDNLLPLFESLEKANQGRAGREAELDGGARSSEIEVEDVGWGVGLREVVLNNLEVSVLLEDVGLRLTCPAMRFKVDEIELDPRYLAERNRAKFELEGDFSIDRDGGGGEHFGLVGLGVFGEVDLFDVATAEFDPEVSLELLFAAESYLSMQIPTLQEWWGVLQLTRSIGLPIGNLPEKASFDQHPVMAHYFRDQVTLQSSIGLEIDDWQVAMRAPSVMNIASTEHVIRGEFRTSQLHGKKVSLYLNEWLEKVPKVLRGLANETLVEEWIVDDRVVVKVSSSGTFDEPRIKLDNRLPDIGERLEEEFKRGLDGLKGLFKKS